VATHVHACDEPCQTIAAHIVHSTHLPHDLCTDIQRLFRPTAAGVGRVEHEHVSVVTAAHKHEVPRVRGVHDGGSI
jgi:hypothetical protein